jgi:hypothetical protein
MRTPTWRRFLLAGVAATLALIGAVAVASAPAQAAVPDRFGFVLWNGAVVSTGTTPSATTVTPLTPGRYQVLFAGQAAAAGVVHVTAINKIPHWCQVESWGPFGVDERVIVRCYRVGPVLENTAFTAIFFQSTGPSGFGPYGYVDANPTGGTFSQYNSSSSVNTVTHGGTGQWDVKFPGIGSAGPRDGSLQATAVNADVGARCNVVSWTSSAPLQDVAVYCFAPSGAPFDTRFTLTYQLRVSLYGPVAPPTHFGYLWWVPGSGPVTTNFNAQTGPGTNSAATAATGLTTVKFPNLGVSPDTVQVTTFGPVPNWCSLDVPWTHAGTDTLVQHANCFTVSGGAINNAFLISDNSLG